MTVEIEGVVLHLAHPDDFPVTWVGQDELMRQLLAAWMVLNDQDVLQVVPGHLPATLGADSISAPFSGEHAASILAHTVGPGVLTTTLPPRCVLDSLANLASLAVVDDGRHLPRSALLTPKACRVRLVHREGVDRSVERVVLIRRRLWRDESTDDPVLIPDVVVSPFIGAACIIKWPIELETINRIPCNDDAAVVAHGGIPIPLAVDCAAIQSRMPVLGLALSWLPRC